MTLKVPGRRVVAAAVCAVALLGGVRCAIAADDRLFSVSVSGPPAVRSIIFIPGLMCSGDVWAAAAARYRGAYRVHVLTLAGFAGRPPLDGKTFLSRVRDDLIGYIREERLDRPIIVGHSLGGFIAFWAAATAPDLVGPIIAVDGVPFMPALVNPAATSDTMKAQGDLMRTMFASMTSEQMLAQSRMSLQTMISDPTNIERAAQWAAASHGGTVGIAMAELFATDLRDEVARIQSPILLIGAAKDAADAQSLSRLTRAYEAQVAKTPRALVVMARHARHFVMMDDPEFLFAAMDAFLAGKPISSAQGL